MRLRDGRYRGFTSSILGEATPSRPRMSRATRASETRRPGTGCLCSIALVISSTLGGKAVPDEAARLALQDVRPAPPTSLKFLPVHPGSGRSLSAHPCKGHGHGGHRNVRREGHHQREVGHRSVLRRVWVTSGRLPCLITARTVSVVQLLPPSEDDLHDLSDALCRERAGDLARLARRRTRSPSIGTGFVSSSNENFSPFSECSDRWGGDDEQARLA